MADDTPIIARTPDGVQHRFPAGTSPDVISGAIKAYGDSVDPLRTGKGMEEATRPDPTLPGNRPKLPEPTAEMPSALAQGGYGIPDLSPGRKVTTVPREEAARQAKQGITGAAVGLAPMLLPEAAGTLATAGAMGGAGAAGNMVGQAATDQNPFSKEGLTEAGINGLVAGSLPV